MSQSKTPRVSFWVPLSGGWALVVLLWLLTPWYVGIQVHKATHLESLKAASATIPSATKAEEPTPESEQITAGTYGDQFGSVNALFSGMALATIAISLWYQRQDIQIQQKALIDQKGVFEKQLRLAATTELVASMPVIRFSVAPKGLFGFDLTIQNTGTEVYDFMASFAQVEGYNRQCQPMMDVFESTLPARVNLEVENILACPDVKIPVELILKFVIRGGEEVKLTYLFFPDQLIIKPTQTWLAVLQKVRDERIGSPE